ncbi:MAG: PQQ-binding-like beta-propeller repeat protein [bacterium]
MRNCFTVAWSTIVVMALLTAGVVSAQTLPGAVVFLPSPERPVGWRGDGSGRYPGATPPTTWSYSYNSLAAEVLVQAGKPGAGRSGKPIGDLRPILDWLILGPFPVANAKEGLETSFVAEETAVQADLGQKVGTNEWRQWSIFPGNQSGQYRGGNLDFSVAFGKLTNQVAYAQANLWSPREGPVAFNLVATEALKIWVNGKVVVNQEASRQAVAHEVPIELVKGWNRLLVKSVSGAAFRDNGGWQVLVQLWPPFADLRDNKLTTTASNLTWLTAMPGDGLSMPIIVGEQLYVSVEPFYLLCLNKQDGKILWMKHHFYFDAVDETKVTEDAAKTAIAKAKTLLAQLDEINAQPIAHINSNRVMSGANRADPALARQKADIEKQLARLVAAVDVKEFRATPTSEQKGSVSTPCSDGKYIYAWYMNGVAACYQPDGTRRWLHKEPGPSYHEHGYCASPVLADGKFVVSVNKLKAFDCATGALAWTADTQGAYASLTVVKSMGMDLILTGNYLALFRPSDGKRMTPDLQPVHDAVSTPIIVDNTIIVFYGNCINPYRTEQWRLPAQEGEGLTLVKSIPWNNKLPQPAQNKTGIGGWTTPCSSPVYHEGLAYFVNEIGVLHVSDLATGEMVYEHWLDLQPTQFYVAQPGVCASLAIAGKYLYVMGDACDTLVIEAGREYKQVAKNTLALGDLSLSTPIFEGSRMYYHGPTWFLCIGK